MKTKILVLIATIVVSPAFSIEGGKPMDDYPQIVQLEDVFSDKIDFTKNDPISRSAKEDLAKAVIAYLFGNCETIFFNVFGSFTNLGYWLESKIHPIEPDPTLEGKHIAIVTTTVGIAVLLVKFRKQIWQFINKPEILEVLDLASSSTKALPIPPDIKKDSPQYILYKTIATNPELLPLLFKITDPKKVLKSVTINKDGSLTPITSKENGNSILHWLAKHNKQTEIVLFLDHIKQNFETSKEEEISTKEAITQKFQPKHFNAFVQHTNKSSKKAYELAPSKVQTVMLSLLNNYLFRIEESSK